MLMETHPCYVGDTCSNDPCSIPMLAYPECRMNNVPTNLPSKSTIHVDKYTIHGSYLRDKNVLDWSWRNTLLPFHTFQDSERPDIGGQSMPFFISCNTWGHEKDHRKIPYTSEKERTSRKKGPFERTKSSSNHLSSGDRLNFRECKRQNTVCIKLRNSPCHCIFLHSNFVHPG